MTCACLRFICWVDRKSRNEPVLEPSAPFVPLEGHHGGGPVRAAVISCVPAVRMGLRVSHCARFDYFSIHPITRSVRRTSHKKKRTGREADFHEATPGTHAFGARAGIHHRFCAGRVVAEASPMLIYFPVTSCSIWYFPEGK